MKVRYKFLAIVGFFVTSLSYVLAEEKESQEALAHAEQIQLVSVASNGNDVRTVLFNLFSQSKKSFVLGIKQKQPLFLNLQDVEFEEALALVCQISHFSYNIQNGIYYISEKPIVEKAKQEGDLNPEIETQRRLSPTVLNKAVTLNLRGTELNKVFDAIGKQLKIKIETHKNVPAYKIDAVLKAKSLKTALSMLTEKIGLKYEFTDRMSILILKRS